MVSPLLSLIFLLQGTPVPPAASASINPLPLKEAVRDFPRSMLQPRISGPVSLDLNQGSRVSYKALAELAGLNVVFDPDFRDRSFTPLHIDNTGILEAFDRLSVLTGNFVEVLDSKTILVSPNNAARRARQYELQVIQTISLTYASSPQEMSAVITTLRKNLNLRYLAMSPDVKAVVIKDSPDRMAAAEKLVSELDNTKLSEAVAVDYAGNLLVPDGSGVRKSSPRRSRLQAGTTRPISIDRNDDSRATCEALAAMAGLNVIFDSDFRTSTIPIRLKLEDVDILDALDFFGLETGSFWEPLDSKTIVVAPDNQTKRRDYSQMLVKTIYFDSITTPQQMTEVITILRTLLNMRYLAALPGANGIGMMDTPGQIALAEKIIADLKKTRPAQAGTGSGITLDVGTETGGLLRTRAARKLAPSDYPLNVKEAVRLSVDMNESPRDAFERVAAMAGLRVNFDERFKDGPARPFTVSDVGILDALDLLSLHTQSFWKAVDATTILVAPDNQSVRRDLESRTEKVIRLSRTPTEAGAREIITALRILLNFRQADVNGNTLVLRETPENVALAEKIVGDLDAHSN